MGTFYTLCNSLYNICWFNFFFEGSFNTRQIEEINMNDGEVTRVDELQALVGNDETYYNTDYYLRCVWYEIG